MNCIFNRYNKVVGLASATMCWGTWEMGGWSPVCFQGIYSMLSFLCLFVSLFLCSCVYILLEVGSTHPKIPFDSKEILKLMRAVHLTWWFGWSGSHLWASVRIEFLSLAVNHLESSVLVDPFISHRSSIQKSFWHPLLCGRYQILAVSFDDTTERIFSGPHVSVTFDNHELELESALVSTKSFSGPWTTLSWSMTWGWRIKIQRCAGWHLLSVCKFLFYSNARRMALKLFVGVDSHMKDTV